MENGYDVVNLHGTASGVIAVPTIGENGNWYIGNKDTGVLAGTGSELEQRIADLEAKYNEQNSDYAVAGGDVQYQDGTANIYPFPEGYNALNCFVMSAMLYRLGGSIHDSFHISVPIRLNKAGISIDGMIASTYIPGKIYILLKKHNLIL